MYAHTCIRCKIKIQRKAMSRAAKIKSDHRVEVDLVQKIKDTTPSVKQLSKSTTIFRIHSQWRRWNKNLIIVLNSTLPIPAKRQSWRRSRTRYIQSMTKYAICESPCKISWRLSNLQSSTSAPGSTWRAGSVRQHSAKCSRTATGTWPSMPTWPSRVQTDWSRELLKKIWIKSKDLELIYILN